MSDFKFDLTLHCGDWASYHWNRELAYCGWMSFHTDIGPGGATKAKPMFKCEVFYSDEDAVFVYRQDSKYKSTPVKAGDTLHFDATKAHALLPAPIAKECVDKNSVWPSKKIFKNLKSGNSSPDTKVRLVWKWKED